MRIARIFLLPALLAVLPFHGSQAFAALRAVAECGAPIFNVGREPCAGAFDGAMTTWYQGNACARMVEENGSLSCSRLVYPGDPVFDGSRNVSMMRPANVPYCVHTVRRPRRDQKYGIERYPECEIRKTRVELDAFLDEASRSQPVYGALYISNGELIAKLTSNANALACLVKTWDGNPLHADLVAQMKNSYQDIAGQEYSADACRSDVPETMSCAADNTTEVCSAQRNMDTAREFLKGNLNEVNALLGDVVASSDSTYRLRLETLATQLAKYVE